MNITFTLGVDGDATDLTSLLTWVEETYHQADITISVPELVSEVTAHAATNKTDYEVHHLISTIENYEAEQRAARKVVIPTTCICGHDNVTHQSEGQTFCFIDKCGCSTFKQIDAPWVGQAINLDQM